MPRRPYQQSSIKPAKKTEPKVSLISFVVHSINRLRGKPDAGYQDALMSKHGLQTRNPWQAVSIIPDYRGCAASKALKEVRFLSDEAPTLPLHGCTAATCNCRYKHYADRRSGPRRATELEIHIHLADHNSIDRRVSRGRRRTDR